MVKFLQHRISDRRILRLIQKWLRAGVSEEGQWSKTKDRSGNPARIGRFTDARERVPALGLRSLGTALAEAPGHRRSHRGSVCGRECVGISVSRRCGAVSPRLAGTPATVRVEATPGQDAPDRVRALRRREPKAAW